MIINMKYLIELSKVMALILCSSLLSFAGELTGTVKSDSGQPLARVNVLTYAPIKEDKKFLGRQLTTRRYETATDENGFFRLPDHGRIVYFKRQDLSPFTKIFEKASSAAYGHLGRINFD